MSKVHRGARRAVYNAAIKCAKAMFVKTVPNGNCEDMRFVMMPDEFDELTTLARQHQIATPTLIRMYWAGEFDPRANWSTLSYEEQLMALLFYAEQVLTGEWDNIDKQFIYP